MWRKRSSLSKVEMSPFPFPGPTKAKPFTACSSEVAPGLGWNINSVRALPLYGGD